MRREERSCWTNDKVSAESQRAGLDERESAYLVIRPREHKPVSSAAYAWFPRGVDGRDGLPRSKRERARCCGSGKVAALGGILFMKVSS